MNNELANALHQSLGIQRPQSPEHAQQLLRAFKPQLARLRALEALVQERFGTTDPDAVKAKLEKSR